MSEVIPDSKDVWRMLAKRNYIDYSQSLTASTNFVSGSKFRLEHVLHLHVLYEQALSPKLLAISLGFPRDRLEEMDKILRKDTDASFLEGFLQDERSIVKSWNVVKARSSGVFAVAMENLHLIAKRGVPQMEENDETPSNKIVISPRKTRNMAHSTTRYPSSSSPTKAFSTPSRGPPVQDLDDSIDVFDLSNISEDLPGMEGKQVMSDLQREKDKFERSDFLPGDEQTVNAALVALTMALSWLLKSTGRVHHDRASFSIPAIDAEEDLYEAEVDGLILHLNGDDCNGFMEVKRDFRGRNSPVRRQIVAQMAAFIYEQDVKAEGKAEKKTEKPTKKAAKPIAKAKGKKAQAKEEKVQDTGDRNQEQLQKWMVSLDGYWAHINIATYDWEYVKFLSGSKPCANDTFMEMKEYGPFDLRVWTGKFGGGLGLFLKYVGALMLGTLGP